MKLTIYKRSDFIIYIELRLNMGLAGNIKRLSFGVSSVYSFSSQEKIIFPSGESVYFNKYSGINRALIFVARDFHLGEMFDLKPQLSLGVDKNEAYLYIALLAEYNKKYGLGVSVHGDVSIMASYRMVDRIQLIVGITDLTFMNELHTNPCLAAQIRINI